jgi:hypothetical protein
MGNTRQGPTKPRPICKPRPKCSLDTLKIYVEIVLPGEHPRVHKK